MRNAARTYESDIRRKSKHVVRAALCGMNAAWRAEQKYDVMMGALMPSHSCHLAALSAHCSCG
eukprot:1276033-Pleurochrysis_carterae.AAC.4